MQLRRPQRPHDVSLFDPAYPGRGRGGGGARGRGRPGGGDPLTFSAPGDRSEHCGSSLTPCPDDAMSGPSRPPHPRASVLGKDKSGEKLTKRMLVNEGLGR